MAVRWAVDRIVHFDRGDFIKAGFVHFGFHDRSGRQYGIEHQRHFLGLVGEGDQVEWTVAPEPALRGVPNIAADLEFPMYVDVLPDATLVVSNLGNARLYRIDTQRMTAELLVDGHELGLMDMGNCVVDDEGCIWVNEVKGCRVWRFDPAGQPIAALGDGTPGFQPGVTSFESVRFNWIYDLRRAPDGSLYVLDSKNFALRVIDIAARCVRTIAGTGMAGYTGDGGDARSATFGSDPTARFDGPISLSLDEAGNAFVGDRFNHVVRMIERDSGMITTIAGRPNVDGKRANDPAERDPLRVNLPQISSMDYDGGRLFVPTDLRQESGDLVVLRRSLAASQSRKSPDAQSVAAPMTPIRPGEIIRPG
ncbi:MAG: hypothetical protein ACXVRU_10020, partial [Gaiellaceae bacterium]